VPLVVSVHGGDLLAPILQRPETRATAGAVLRGAAAVMCNSRATLERAAALAGSADHMRVVHLGAEAPDPLPPKRPDPTLATLAHVVPRKRHVDVLRAIAELPGVRWVVIGDGPELPALRSLAGELGVADRVEFRGQLHHDAALRELARCHVMALPSEDEAFGVAYAEALACGVPAIGLEGEGGPEEIASLGEGIVLAPARDPHELANIVRDLLADTDELRLLGTAARRTAESRLSWQRCGVETVAIYEAAAARGGRGVDSKPRHEGEGRDPAGDGSAP
jgi:glycosyltransferase involved in cell wall biosynthesis